MFDPKLIETDASKLTNAKYCLFKSLYEGVICDIFEVAHYRALGYTDTPKTFPRDSVDDSKESKQVKAKRSKRIKQLELDTEEVSDVVE